MANQPKKYKKFVATAATATLVASAIVPVASAASLSDVAGNTHEAAINALVDAKVINGYADGTFKPNKTLTRSDVVKLLGKYLESQGYEAASDYKTSPRFSDLTSSSNEELLKYAAIVADNGVFSGSNGKLLAGDNITRENMAVVLVRMINTLKGANLEEYVAGQSYTKEVKDLNAAKAEARSAIEVLDFYDITTATTFNPKGSTTRGQFATFLNNTINADFSGASATTGTVKAINATTVEVTFAEGIEDIKALNFAIEGLEVTNAVVKQTDKKTAVLTTAPQKAGTEYTVTVNGNTVGKFVGISAVIPTAIDVVEKSQQGVLGQQVTVKAQVTVAEGQSKAGIPVTFNVTGTGSLNDAQLFEATTNAEGVATYTYTRYANTTDDVVAYATGDRTKFSAAKVYWATAAKLTITEVTEGNTLANGSKKVYKIKTDSYATAYVENSTTNVDYNYVNVAFNENLDVAPDKLVRGVDVIDTGVSTNANYPYQIKDSGVNEVRVKVNAAGEATFTLNGSNAAVTPTVFVDADKNGKFGATELKATAATVKFDLNHTLGLAVKAEGVQNAAAINAKGFGEGGRNYTVTITDKDGKVAPAGTVAYVTFAEGSYSTDKAAYILDANDNRVRINKNTVLPIKVAGTKGEASFTLVGDRDSYAAPTVYIENGKEAGLDKADLQTVGETTYFVDAVVNNAALKVKNAAGKEVTTLLSSQDAYFHYSSVDQNGFDYYTGTGAYEVSFQVTAQFADVTVYGTGFGSKVVSKGTTETVKVQATNGKAELRVFSEHVSSNVTVNASASQVSLPNKSATVSFTSSLELPAVHTGYVTNLDETNEKIKIDAYNAVSYKDGSYVNVQNQTISKAQFVTALKSVAPGQKAQVTVTKQADGTYKFNINSLTVAKTPAELLEEAFAKLSAAKATTVGLVEARYTPASWATYTTAIAAANALPEGILTEVNAKTAAITAAVSGLVTIASEDAANTAALNRLNAAKTLATTKNANDYTTASFGALTTAVTNAATPGVTANQKIAQAVAIETAIANLVAKSAFSGFTIVAATGATTGELTLTFTETSATPVTGFAVDSISAVNVATTGTVVSLATATATSPAANNVVKLTVTDDAATPAALDLTLAANQAATYTFTATVTGTDLVAKDITVEVKFVTGTGWTAVTK